LDNHRAALPNATARSIAARVLTRVWSQSAYASAALDAELRHNPGIDPRDIGLATELVYGVLRMRGYLEARLAELSSKQRGPLDPEARAHLLMGAYTVAFLDRVPPFAAVSEAVHGVAGATDSRVAGYANAVLRRFAEAMAIKRPVAADAIVQGAPGWLRGALRRSLGRAQAEAFLAAGPVPPPLGICVARPDARTAWIDRLRALAPAASIEAGSASPRSILVRGAGDVRRLPGFEKEWIIQEEGSQLIALSLGAQPGETILDACAGRGNKAWLFAHQVEPGGAVDAADLHPAKLSMLAERGHFVRSTFPVDWTIGPGDVPEGYDRVLVDAPCSGTGTLRRRPEIAERRSAEDLVELATLQADIVRAAATRVRTDGRLVYAVCSVLREEGSEVVERLIHGALPSGAILEPARFDEPRIDELATGEPSLRLFPHVHGTDGYFLASFIVRRSAS
jgi:16S rRNA (cytosine967-C5)-methyltransferase